jgi:hypothetical protein
MRSLMRSVALVSVLFIGGCSAGAGETATDEAGVPVADSAPEEASADQSTNDVSGDTSAPSAADLTDRSIITEGSVSLLVEDPGKAAQDAAQLVESAGGFVQERVERAGAEDEAATAYLVVRVPSAKVTSTLEELKQLGEVQETSLTSSEVTAQVRDLDARIRASEISVERLEAILAQSTTVEEIFRNEQVLTERQSELEALKAQAAGLGDQVRMATFRLDLWSVGAEPVEPLPAPTGFMAGLSAGWTAFVTSLTAFLQVFGALLPWLIFLGLVTAGALALRREYRRRVPARVRPTGPATSLPVHPTGLGQMYPQHGATEQHTGAAPAGAPVVPPADPHLERSHPPR